jgi:PAS domain S-box-containing protein
MRWAGWLLALSAAGFALAWWLGHNGGSLAVGSISKTWMFLLGLDTVAVIGLACAAIQIVRLRTMRDALHCDAQLSLQLDAVPMTLLKVDRTGRITYVNEAWREFARRNGADATTIAGVGIELLDVVRVAGSGDATEIERTLAAMLLGNPKTYSCVYPCHSLTELRWFKLDAQHVESDGSLLLSHSDVTKHHLAEARLDLQSEVAQLLAERTPILAACRRLMVHACEGFEWDFGAVWERGEGEEMRCCETWSRPGVDVSAFERATREANFRIETALPGRTWAGREPEWIVDLLCDPSAPRAPYASVSGLHTGFAVPIAADNEVFAVVEMFGRIKRQPDSELMELLVRSGIQLGHMALRDRAQHHFRQILDAISDLVLVKGPGSRIIWGNKAFRDLYGMSNEELQGLIDAPFVPSDVTERYVLDDAVVFSTGTVFTTEEPVTGADGRVLRYRTQKSPIRDASGRVVMTVGVSHDITARTRLEAELHLAARMASVGTLASGIAHEINTPIQYVNDSILFVQDASKDLFEYIDRLRKVQDLVLSDASSTELQVAAEAARAAESTADLEYLHEHLPKAFDRCSGGLARVTTIVRSMKEFAHPSVDGMSHTDLNRAIRTTLTVASNEYQCVADLSEDMAELPEVICHVNEINQVILNLVVNAAHAIAEVGQQGAGRGSILVRTRHEGSDVIISVADNGCGIHPAVAPRVFEPFFTTKEVGKGAGQGLAMVWSVVKDKHGGDIWFDSKPGVGSTFFVRLPVAGKQAAPCAGVA